MTALSPTRLHSFQRMQQSTLFSMLLSHFSIKPLAPSYTEYLQLNKALVSGDTHMDAVVSWVMQNPKQNRKLFEQALYQGFGSLSPAVAELTRFFQYIETPPSWVNQKRLDSAVEFTHRLGINNGFVLRDLSLMAGYLYPGFNQPLMMTGALNKQAGTRLAETTKWWMDITEPNALMRFHAGFTSTLYVRFIHSLVRYHLKHKQEWDSETWGLPINQFDLAMTNLAFSSVVLIGIRALGIFPSQQETENFLHFWRYIGWLMGIDEPWLVETESEGWRFLYWMQFAHPESDQSSHALGTSLSNEPFERQYRYLRPLQQKLAYKQHLEVTQFFIGKKRMQRLGLKSQSASWFAYYLIARNLTLYNGARYIPALNHFLRRKGRETQKLGLTLYQSKAKHLASMHR